MQDIITDDREAQEVERAVDLIQLGARLHLLEAETRLSRERLLALYREVKGTPPAAEDPEVPADWFLDWQPNIHAALFIGMWRYLKAFAGAQGIDAIAGAYRFYMEHMQATGLDPILTVTRAWTLVRYLDVLLGMVPCKSCGGESVVEAEAARHEALCGLCRARRLSGRGAAPIAGSIAEGNLSNQIEVRGSDETARLMQSFAHMQDALRTLVSEINSGVEHLSMSATELSAAASQVSAASDKQSEAAAAMAASVEQMTVGIAHISDRGADTQGVSTETGRLSREGAAVVRRSADEMEQIAASVNQSAESVRRLGEKSKEIAHIVSVIKDIADQTNLLALNAAIEAARAGEQGRGFAVVADEVRKLSEKTAGSTNEIAAMIDAIALGTAEAVTTMERGVGKVAAGVALARDAGESITRIEAGSSKLLLAVNDISDALKEQSQASNDIAKHVERIAQMTEENNIAVKETAHASQSLEQLAGSLQASVGRFRL